MGEAVANSKPCEHGEDLKIWLAQETAGLAETESRFILQACDFLLRVTRDKRHGQAQRPRRAGQSHVRAAVIPTHTGALS